MAPRKPSTGTTPGESVPASTARSQSQTESDAAAYREYLLAQTGVPPDMPPPVENKGKKAKKASPKSMSEDEATGAPYAAKSGEVGPETPRNAGASKTRITLKRKASEILTASSEPPKSDGLKHDSATETPTTGKKSSKKRKVASAEDETAAPVHTGNDAAPATPSAKRPPTKKPKAVAVEDTAASISPKNADNDASPPTKEAKRASPKRKDAAVPKASRKGKGKKSDEVFDDLPPPLPAPKQIGSAVAAKVRLIQEFVNTISETATTLQRDPLDSSLISVPEITLVGALMRMRVDYDVGDPYEAQLSDADSIILTRFTAPVQQTPHQRWVTIDASKRIPLEDSVLEHVAGHGIDTHSLLEIELEMLGRSQQAPPPERVSAPINLQAFYDHTRRKVHDDSARAEAAEMMASERACREMERHWGVCPIPRV
ncbi:hypothetical protein LTR36_010707 [Oleoguttula mirabilis]|uniref:Uncharacterized protein n=1 Tax=Oleoguttula mirabilis TaxID=1507867 RepID=A0AAV9JSK4_9PEZI|nr:hypothetical protein LTR36_010707 [Oleoguttula mirabilis]